jgi:hypothetical protein
MSYTDSSTTFLHPFSCIISGASQTGKTVFTQNLLRCLDSMVSPRITNVILSFAENQTLYDDIKNMDSRIKLVNGYDYDILPNSNTLIIIDDQMSSAMKDSRVQDLFTKGVHHKSISVILITQDLFPPEKYARTIRRNCTYLIIFKSPTFRSQVMALGGQLYPESRKFLCSAYDQATQTPYTYIFVNLHPMCPDKLRIRSGILPYESTSVYLPI